MSAAHALPMFREARQRSTRKQLEKDRLDPKKSHKPEPPVSGPGNVHMFLIFYYVLLLLQKSYKKDLDLVFQNTPGTPNNKQKLNYEVYEVCD